MEASQKAGSAWLISSPYPGREGNPDCNAVNIGDGPIVSKVLVRGFAGKSPRNLHKPCTDCGHDPVSPRHRFAIGVGKAGVPRRLLKKYRAPPLGAPGSPNRRRRPAGIARATSRGANDRGGSLPPQPEGRRGVWPWIFVGVPHRCYRIAVGAPPCPGPQDRKTPSRWSLYFFNRLLVW